MTLMTKIRVFFRQNKKNEKYGTVYFADAFIARSLSPVGDHVIVSRIYL